MNPLLTLDVSFLIPFPAGGRVLVTGGKVPKEVSRSLTGRGLIVHEGEQVGGLGVFDVVLSLRALSPGRASLPVIRELSLSVSTRGMVVMGFENPLNLITNRHFGVVRLLRGLVATRSIQRAMSEAGLAVGGIYGVFPSLEEGRTLVPLDDCRPMDFYLTHLFFPSATWLREQLLRIFHGRRAFAVIPPGYLVWGTRG
jgi:hypothetical protein